jgi:tetratricopeptide (TPR) repeat protein
MPRLQVGLFVMLCIPIIPFTAVPPQDRSAASTPHRLTQDELQEWATAVASHESGLADPAAVRIARWPPGQLYVLFSELRTLEAFRKNPRVRQAPADNTSYPAPRMRPSEISKTLGLTPAEIQTGNINRLLERAALLHTDVALLVPNVVRLPRLSPFSGLTTVDIRDGLKLGANSTAAHLELTSWLLDGVRPDPSADDGVRAWYQAITATLALHRRIADAGWLLERARAIFPSDALILFYNGALHETLSAPLVRAVLQSGSRPTPFAAGDPAEQQELLQAAWFFQRALEVSPGFAEARLHLGRVHGRLGRHEAAAADLTAAAALLTDHTLLYYAWLFLGHEKDLLGDREAARENFERAAAMYPRAQSPLLAESELARRTGDSSGALAPLDQLLALPADEKARDDPWWWYEVSHAIDAGELLSTWRAAVAGRAMR